MPSANNSRPSCRHCHQPVDSDEQRRYNLSDELWRCFCAHCGYPLGQATLHVNPTQLNVNAGAPSAFTTTIVNEGPGVLYYALDLEPSLPITATAQRRGQVPPLENKSIEWRIPADSLSTTTTSLTIVLSTLTAGPQQPGRKRLQPSWELWEEQRSTLPITHRRRGPVRLDADALLVGFGVETAEMRVLNYGDLDLPCRAEWDQPEFEVLCDGTWRSHDTKVVLRAGLGGRPRLTRLTVRAREGGAASCELRLLPEGLPPQTVVVTRVVPADHQGAQYRYTVGIDFGTAKTAVCVVDNHFKPPQPKLVTWPRPSGAVDSHWLPSAVFYPNGEQRPRVGDSALAGLDESDVSARLQRKLFVETDRGRLFVGIKMLLGAQSGEEAMTPSPRQVATDYFRYLFGELRDRAPLDLDDALFVLSLPVMEDPTRYHEQEENTRRAAVEAGAAFAIKEEQFLLKPEPVCAAIDLVRLELASDDDHAGLQDGEWVVVYDAGAGTTDITVLQVHQVDREYQFKNNESLGFEWGGDNLDRRILDSLLQIWSDPNLRRQPDVKPKYVAPADAPVEAGDKDQDELLRQQSAYRLAGAQRTVSRGELLRAASRFKERHLADQPDLADESKLTLATPVRELVKEQVGDQLSAEPLTAEHLRYLSEAVQDELAALGGYSTNRLKEELDRLRIELNIDLSRPPRIYPVGGTTLARGWRQAAESLDWGRVVSLGTESRRFHVARGAAQWTQQKMEAPLPDDVVLEVEIGTPWDGFTLQPDPHRERHTLRRGTTPGSRSTLPRTMVARLDLARSQYVSYCVRLGKQLLRRQDVSPEEVRRCGGAVLQNQTSVNLEATIGYCPGDPPTLQLTIALLVEGTPRPVNVPSVTLPRFEA